jgi:hypothetical protein
VWTTLFAASLARKNEGFVPSSGGFCRQPLEIQQVEFRRLADQARQQGMNVTAVVGLVIEPMGQRRSQPNACALASAQTGVVTACACLSTG